MRRTNLYCLETAWPDHILTCCCSIAGVSQFQLITKSHILYVSDANKWGFQPVSTVRYPATRWKEACHKEDICHFGKHVFEIMNIFATIVVKLHAKF